MISRRIILVDDEIDVITKVKRIFQLATEGQSQFKYEIIPFNNTKDVETYLGKNQEQQYVVVADLRYENDDPLEGIKLLEYIHDHHRKNVRSVALTGRFDSAIARDLLKIRSSGQQWAYHVLEKQENDMSLELWRITDLCFSLLELSQSEITVEIAIQPSRIQASLFDTRSNRNLNNVEVTLSPQTFVNLQTSSQLAENIRSSNSNNIVKLREEITLFFSRSISELLLNDIDGLLTQARLLELDRNTTNSISINFRTELSNTWLAYEYLRDNMGYLIERFPLSRVVSNLREDAPTVKVLDISKKINFLYMNPTATEDEDKLPYELVKYVEKLRDREEFGVRTLLAGGINLRHLLEVFSSQTTQSYQIIHLTCKLRYENNRLYISAWKREEVKGSIEYIEEWLLLNDLFNPIPLDSRYLLFVEIVPGDGIRMDVYDILSTLARESQFLYLYIVNIGFNKNERIQHAKTFYHSLLKSGNPKHASLSARQKDPVNGVSCILYEL